ncbi:MAG: DUF167 domain-containing protein [Aggregatilineales bacterium]
MTADRKFEITDARGGSALTLRVVTQAQQTEWGGVQEDGSLKVRLVASPAGSPAANAELLTFLASSLGVSESQLEIVVGAHGREKIVSVEGLTTQELEARLSALLG